MAEMDRLAIDGGPPAVAAGPFPWPPEDAAIKDSLDAAWRDGDWGRYHGARCERLREAVAELHAVEHAHLCSSGTIAVELALRAVGVGAGDGVLLAGYDFAGNFRAIEAIGAVPVLVDIDPRSWSMDVALLDELAALPDAQGVRAVVVSHLHGGVADMRALCRVAHARGWWVVEDACQSPGATLGGRPLGSWGDVGVLSFGGSKLLTAGRGGALLTNDAAIAQRLKVLTGRGNDSTPLSELQAAVLLPQLDLLAKRHAARERAAERLVGKLGGLEKHLLPVQRCSDASHAYYKLALLAASRLDRVRLIKALQAEGAPIDEGFRGFAARSNRRCRRLGTLENSNAASQRTVLLHHPALLAGDKATDQIATAISKVIAAECGV